MKRYIAFHGVYIPRCVPRTTFLFRQGLKTGRTLADPRTSALQYLAPRLMSIILLGNAHDT